MRLAQRTKRYSKYDAYKFSLEFLRCALARKESLLRVTRIQDVPSPLNAIGSFATEVMIEVQLPLKHSRTFWLPVPAKRIEEFFQGREMQESFLRWYGKCLADRIPYKSRAAKLKKSLANLKVGRTGKLPPQILLEAEYERLILEMQSMHLKFPGCSGPLSKQEREAILTFGKKASAQWVQFVEKGEIDIDQITKESPQEAAKLILSKKYGCSEDSIHSRLHRGA